MSEYPCKLAHDELYAALEELHAAKQGCEAYPRKFNTGTPLPFQRLHAAEAKYAEKQRAWAECLQAAHIDHGPLDNRL